MHTPSHEIKIKEASMARASELRKEPETRSEVRE